MKHEWRIELAERTVDFNADKDLRVFGKPFSHPFLVLKSPDGTVASEIHGTWPKNELTYPVAYLINRFTSAARSDKATAFAHEIMWTVFPKAIIVATQGLRNDHKAVARTTVFKGSEDQAHVIWLDMRSRFPALNAREMPFYQYATPSAPFANCQKMLRLAMDSAAGFGTIPDLQLAQTGWTEAAKPAITLP